MVVLLGMGDGGGLGAPLRLIKEFICADSACLPRSFLGTLEATFGAEVDKARGQLWGHLKKDVFLYSSNINMLRRLFGSCPRNHRVVAKKPGLAAGFKFERKGLPRFDISIWRRPEPDPTS
jgi:hypothetical protein